MSRLVELGRKIDVLVTPVEMYIALSKPRRFGRAGRNASRLIELGRNLDFTGSAGRNIYRLVQLGQNIIFLVAPVETYLAWANLVET